MACISCSTWKQFKAQEHLYVCVINGLHVLCLCLCVNMWIVCVKFLSDCVYRCSKHGTSVRCVSSGECQHVMHEVICVHKECKLHVCVCVCLCNEGVQRELWLFSPPAVWVLWLCGPQGKRPVFSVWELTFCPLIAALLQPRSFLFFF